MSDRTVKTIKGWVAVTPRGRLVDLGGGEIWTRSRSFKWTDDTQWKRATITITIDDQLITTLERGR